MDTIIPTLTQHDNIPHKAELVEYFQTVPLIHSVYVRGSIAFNTFIDGLSDYDLIILTNPLKGQPVDKQRITHDITQILKNYNLDVSFTEIYDVNSYNKLPFRLKCESLNIYVSENGYNIIDKLPQYTLQYYYDNSNLNFKYIIKNSLKVLRDRINIINKYLIEDKDLNLSIVSIKTSKKIIRIYYKKYLPQLNKYYNSCKTMYDELIKLELDNNEKYLLDIADNALKYKTPITLDQVNDMLSKIC